MMTFLKNLKLHLFYARIAFFVYKKGLRYLWMRYIRAPRLARVRISLESPVTEQKLSMHTMFGSRDFVMALWSLASFYKVSKIIGNLTIHSDGSLTKRHKHIITTFFPSARVLSLEEGRGMAKPYCDRFETIRAFRDSGMWQAVKFIDVPASSRGTHTFFFDSDILWFRSPHEIENMLREQKVEGAMMSNGLGPLPVSLSSQDRISDQTLRYNAGIIFFHQNAFSWERADTFLKRCNPYPHFTDQIGFALAISPLKLLSEEEYAIKGKREGELTAKHYTSPRRGKFYLEGIPYLLSNSLSGLRNLL